MNQHDGLDPVFFSLFEFRPTKGDLKKLDIIKATIECLSTIGIEKTTYEAIAQKVGTRRAHIAYHFNDKKLIFIAVIKFIMITYQENLLTQMKETTSGKKMILQYIEGFFQWARNYPEHVTVMLLLYYHCQLDEDFLDLHHELRNKGYQRLNYILEHQFKVQGPKSRAGFYAKQIQNLLSGTLMDCKTSKNRSLDQAQKEVTEMIFVMISDLE